MAPSAKPDKPTLRSKLHIKPSTSLKVSRVAIFVLLTLISAQTVGSALLWYAGKIKADSSSVRAVNVLAPTGITRTGVSLHATTEIPSGITQRGFEYGQDTDYGKQVLNQSGALSYATLGDTATAFSDHQHPASSVADASGNIYVLYTDTVDGSYAGNEKIVKFGPNGNIISEFGSHGSGDGQLDQATDIAVDASGNIYIADSSNHRVQKFSNSGTYISQFATTEQSTGYVVDVSSLVVDAAGNIIIAGSWDESPLVIGEGRLPILQKYNPSGSLVAQIINSEGTGTSQLANAAFWPDVATDSSNNIYISDQPNNRVLKYDNNGSFVTQWTASNSGAVTIKNDVVYVVVDGGIKSYSTSGALVYDYGTGPYALMSLLNIDSRGKLYLQTQYLAVVTQQASIDATVSNLQCDTTYHFRAFVTDASGTDYSADSMFTTSACYGLRSITARPATDVSQAGATLHGSTDYPQGITGRGFQYGLTGGYGSTIADGTTLQENALTGVYGSYGGSDGQFHDPSGIATSSNGLVFVADTWNHRIQKLDKNGNFLAQWGTEGSADGELAYPMDIATDNTGYVYVADWQNFRIQKFDFNGNFVAKWGSRGTGDGQFENPQGIAVGPDGSVYVTDCCGSTHTRIQKFDANGNFITKWGSYGLGNGQFSAVTTGIAVDSNNNVYVLNSGYTEESVPDASVQKFSSNGTFIAKWGSYGSGDGQFISPSGIALDTAGNIYIADESAHVVSKLDKNGIFLGNWIVEGYYAPRSITVDKSGQAFVAAGDAVKRYSTAIDASITNLSCGTTYHYRPYVTDRGGTQYGNDATFTTDACPAVEIVTTSLDDGHVGGAYQDNIVVANDSGAVTYSISSSSLPPGLSIDSSTGYITGNPTEVGTYYFDVTVDDGHSTDTASLSIIVTDVQPLAITTQSLPNAQLNGGSYLGYQEYIYTQDSVSDVTFNITAGALPDGLSLSQSGSVATIEGTPSDLAGTYTFTVQAQDSRGNGDGGTDSKEYTISLPTIHNINILTTSLPQGQVGLAYNKSIDYEYAQTQPVFSVESGSLPAGVSLTLNGYLQGTPTAAGTYNFTVKADDGLSYDTQSYSLTIIPAAVLQPSGPFVTITSPTNGASAAGTSMSVAGTGPGANKVIQISIDGVVHGTTTTGDGGTWTYQASGLSAGSHSLNATWIPGNDVVFVPFMAPNLFDSGIQIIDNATLQPIRTVSFHNARVISVALNHARTKLYATGFRATNDEMTEVEAAVWEVDLSTMVVRSHAVGSGFVTGNHLRISADDSLAVLGGITMQNDQSFTESVTRINLAALTTVGQPVMVDTVVNFNPYAMQWSMAYSADQSKVYAIGDQTSHAVTVLNTQDDSSTNIYLGSDDAYTPSILQVVGSTLFVRTTSRLLVIDTQTNNVLRDIDMSSNIPTYGWGLMVANQDGTSVAVLARDMSALVDVDVASGVVTTRVDAEPADAAGMVAAVGGLGYTRTSDGTMFYIAQSLAIYGVSDQLLVYGGMTSNTGDPRPESARLMPTGTYVMGLGNGDSIAPIRPTASVTFSLTAASSCTTTNTCPVTPPSNCATTNTCPVTPPPVVDPPVPATVGATNPKSPKIVVTPFPPAASATSRLGWFDRGILAVAHFVPRQAAIGFPYLLFILLLIFALSLYYQSTNEVRKDKLNREFIAKRKSIRAQQDNFIALASHYLNTPITIIQNGIEVMGERGSGPKGK